MLSLQSSTLRMIVKLIHNARPDSTISLCAHMLKRVPILNLEDSVNFVSFELGII